MTTIQRFAELIGTANRIDEPDAIDMSRVALIDTIACTLAGSTSEITAKTLRSVSRWGSGDALVVGHSQCLNPPFAAMVNGASAHALDFDDFDRPGNAHPSAVIFPALFALSAEKSVSGMDVLDAHIMGVEVIQRLGEAMNMDHYRRGWVSTLTLGSVGATAACARLLGFNPATAAAALSLSTTMASGMTNQGGVLAKQLIPGLAAKNGVMASSLAAEGITANADTIDGAISLASVMGGYRPERFDAALAKLGNPWSITEHGLFSKMYPTCSYSHRAIDCAKDIHRRLATDVKNIRSITISLPDYCLDLLVYPEPSSAAQAMFSAQYNVAYALVHGKFDFAALQDASIFDAVLKRLCQTTKVISRRPRDPDVLYDPLDPDWVEIQLSDGTAHRSETAHATGSPAEPFNEAILFDKFTACIEHRDILADGGDIWNLLVSFEQLDDLGDLIELLRFESTTSNSLDAALTGSSTHVR